MWGTAERRRPPPLLLTWHIVGPVPDGVAEASSPEWDRHLELPFNLETTGISGGYRAGHRVRTLPPDGKTPKHHWGVPAAGARPNLGTIDPPLRRLAISSKHTRPTAHYRCWGSRFQVDPFRGKRKPYKISNTIAPLDWRKDYGKTDS